MSSRVAGRIVGREREIALARAALGIHDGAGGSLLVGGAGGSLLVGGAAGIGKTALVARMVNDVESTWQVLIGHCVGEGGAGLPYLPFAEIFARLDETDSAFVDRLVTTHPGLAALLPRAGAAAPTARSAIVEGVHGALESVARERPTLVVVEDVHWADESSRDLLTVLFARGVRGPLALLVTYRSDDVHRRHPLAGSLTLWTRVPGLTRLDLGPLDSGDMRTLVSRLDVDLTPDQVERIAERSEGNAFFAEELAQAAGKGPVRDTTDLSRLLLSRIDGLSEEARAVIRVAAVVGRRVPHGLLGHLAGGDEVELHRLLREAVDHHVLEVSGSADYVFRHALLAEAVRDDLLPGERLALHRLCVRALLEHPELGSAADLARHASASGDLPTALAASLTAGAQAERMGGPAEALGHYEAALSMTSDSERLHEIVLRAAAAGVGSGRTTRALAVLRGRLRQLVSPEQRAELLTRLAFVARLTEEHVDRVALTNESLSLLGDDSPPVLRADALTRRAEALLDRGETDAARADTEAAVLLSDRHGLVHQRADLATILARMSEEAGDLENTLSRLRAVVDEWTGPPDLSLLRAMHILASVHYRQGDFPAALDAYLASLDRAREVGLEHSLYGVDSRSQAVVTAWEMGAWDRALAIADHAGEDLPELVAAALDAAASSVHAARGQRTAVEWYPRIRQSWQHDGMYAVHLGAAAMETHGWAGDIPAMRATLNDVVLFLRDLWRESPLRLEVRLAATATGQLAATMGQRSARERSDLLSEAERMAADASLVWGEGSTLRPPTLEGRCWMARLDAEVLRVRLLAGEEVDGPALVSAWTRAVALFEQRAEPYEVARSLAGLAEALIATGTGHPAPVIERARGIAEALGAVPLLRRIPTLPASGRAVAAALTHREREVLAQLAQGRSNGDIGRALFISTKTVSVHVSRILAKLEVASRGEAVAMARTRGLLDR